MSTPFPLGRILRLYYDLMLLQGGAHPSVWLVVVQMVEICLYNTKENWSRRKLASEIHKYRLVLACCSLKRKYFCVKHFQNEDVHNL